MIVCTREDFLPDPQYDPVQVIFWCLQTEDEHIESNGFQEGYHVGVIALGHSIDIPKIGVNSKNKENRMYLEKG